MKRPGFIALVSLIIAAAAFFASAKPDGLDFLSEKLGFAHKAVEGHGLMSDYSLSFLGQGPVSTLFAGLIGVIFLCGMFSLLNYIYSRKA